MTKQETLKKFWEELIKIGEIPYQDEGCASKMQDDIMSDAISGKYPKKCKECGAIIENYNEDAGDSGICYKCY